jgi:pimeloyl-ACP methyl ester carboxylesterase
MPSQMIFIHGAGFTSTFWHYQTSYFKNSEAISLPGHPEGKPCTSVTEYTDWLRGYIREMDYKRVILVGHSLGGAIAMDYGLRYPGDLKALILIGTGAKLRVHPDFLASCEEGTRDIGVWMEAWEPTYDLVLPELKTKLFEERILVGPGVQLRDLLCCDRFDVMADIQRIELPALVICGSEDRMTPVKYSQFLAGKIKGARQMVIEGGTHLVPAEKPAEVNQAIEEFLRSLRDAVSAYPDR